jgi:ABC-2 type transport system ATP-binding protein
VIAPRLVPASSNSSPALSVVGLVHRYGDRVALAGIDLEIARGEMFGLLGPNGGGKTTLFKVLATLVPPQQGKVEILGCDVAEAAGSVRPHLGVVFQHPSIDPKLTVTENLRCHGALYGLSRAAVRERAATALGLLGLTARAHDRVEMLSGGLARRLELAKALLHAPALLVLDEPSTGLDPGARRDFLHYLMRLRDTAGVTVVLTTHMIEEAERCDRVGFMHQGALVGVGTPDELKAQVGGDVVVMQSAQPERLAARIRQHFRCEPRLVDGVLRVELPRGHEFAREVMDVFPGDIQSVTFGKPTLEDVFVHLTGHRFWTDTISAAAPV